METVIRVKVEIETASFGNVEIAEDARFDRGIGAGSQAELEAVDELVARVTDRARAALGISNE